MNVYLVIAGERGEGGNVNEVYLTKKKALDHGKKLAQKFAKDYMATIEKINDPCDSHLKPNGSIVATWYIACDYVIVERRKVIQ